MCTTGAATPRSMVPTGIGAAGQEGMTSRFAAANLDIKMSTRLVVILASTSEDVSRNSQALTCCVLEQTKLIYLDLTTIVMYMLPLFGDYLGSSN